MTTLRLRNPNQMALKHRFEAMADGDVLTHGFDWSRLLGSATISSVDWTVRDRYGNSSTGITTSSPANASGVSTTACTASDPGDYVIDCKMTDSAGNIRTARAAIRVLLDSERY